MSGPFHEKDYLCQVRLGGRCPMPTPSATLPYALSVSLSSLGSVQVGFRPVRALQSWYRPRGPMGPSQSPGLGGRVELDPSSLSVRDLLWFDLLHFARSPLAAPPLYAAASPLRSGSYTSALSHRACSSTDSLRATATTARFFAFFRPRAASASPQRRRSVSGPNGPRM